MIGNSGVCRFDFLEKGLHMSFIRLAGDAALKYRGFLEDYRQKTGKEPGPVERTEAFFCARSEDPWNRPTWCR